MRYVIKNGKIVTEYGIKEGLSLVTNEDKIEGLFIDSYTDKNSIVIDAKGGYIAPGLIDIHSDYIYGRNKYKKFNSYRNINRNGNRFFI